jgi:hypothetical protein
MGRKLFTNLVDVSAKMTEKLKSIVKVITIQIMSKPETDHGPYVGRLVCQKNTIATAS